ncbi:hypothetical protein MSUIS_00430 [Mycoplasma suis KI3806]|uniref:Uncharacterized protein n=1 Tax=Mycoplasma suis (strain KI_3806) TaxID=708248 RepID=F0V2R4_MYCS3|nr:hypothetical protein [Mycoplasma suis]CBZ40136.1 hypothetical protein MSUIS_00430 [Mycoplasma suis KI3806]
MWFSKVFLSSLALGSIVAGGSYYGLFGLTNKEQSNKNEGTIVPSGDAGTNVLENNNFEKQDLSNQKNIYLEGIWKFKFSREAKIQRNCFSIKESDSEKKIPNIAKEKDLEDLCEQIEEKWTKEKDMNHLESGFWTRGKTKAIKDLVEANWQNLFFESGFVKTKEKLSTPEEKLQVLKQTCNLNNEKIFEDWLEISCLKNWN